jgi:hypothetical protein
MGELPPGGAAVADVDVVPVSLIYICISLFCIWLIKLEAPGDVGSVFLPGASFLGALMC